LQYPKVIGEGYKKEPQQEMPFVTKEIFVEECQFFHVDRLNYRLGMGSALVFVDKPKINLANIGNISELS